MTVRTRDTNCLKCKSKSITFDQDYGFYQCESCGESWAYSEDDPDYDDVLTPKFLSLVAGRGDAEAQCILGNLYQLGLGVDVDEAEAIKWYKASAEQGYGVASSNLAGMLPDEASFWYQKAKEQGFIVNNS